MWCLSPEREPTRTLWVRGGEKSRGMTPRSRKKSGESLWLPPLRQPIRMRTHADKVLADRQLVAFSEGRFALHCPWLVLELVKKRFQDFRTVPVQPGA